MQDYGNFKLKYLYIKINAITRNRYIIFFQDIYNYLYEGAMLKDSLRDYWCK